MTTNNEFELDRNKNIHYIHEHKRAFQSTSLYPLDIFERFVEKAKGWGLECSCKIGENSLDSIRFNLFYNNPSSEQFSSAIDFFRQVEARDDVSLDHQSIQQFLGNDFDFNKIVQILVGVDLREQFAASRLKLWFVLQNYSEKLEKAIALCEPPEEIRLLVAHLNLVVVGFDLYLNGCSAIELYPRILQNDLENADLREQLKKIMSPSTLELLQGWAFGFGYSKANPETILYYPPPAPNKFIASLNNPIANRVHAYYQEQPVKATIVAFRESELLTGAVKNLSLYYQMSLPFYKRSATYKSLLPDESSTLKDLD